MVAHLSATRVSRRLLVYAVPVVLVVLAVGATTLSGLYAGTSSDLRTRLAALGQGADVRATLESRPIAGQAGQIAALPPVADVRGAQAVAPVWSSSTDVGDTEAVLLGAPLDTLGQVAIVPDGAADPAELGDLVAAAPPPGTPVEIPIGPVEIPIGTDSVELDVDLQVSVSPDRPAQLSQEVTSTAKLLEEETSLSAAEALEQAEQDVLGLSSDSTLQVSLLLQDPESGVVQRVVAGSLPPGVEAEQPNQGKVAISPTPGRSTVTIPVPEGTAYQVIGIDIDRIRLLVDLPYTIDVALIVDGQRRPTMGAASRWQVQLPLGESPPKVQAGPDGGLIVNDSTGGALAHSRAGSMIPLRSTPVSSGSLPLAITRPLAEANNLQVGSPVDIDGYGTAVSAEVAAVVEAVPGAESRDVALVDAGGLSRALLAQGEVLPDPVEIWVGGTNPRALAESVAQVPGIATATRAAPVPVTDAAAAVRLVFWVASAGSVLLAGTGVAAVAATLVSARRSEVAVLRALGMPASAQARARVAELAGIVLAAVSVGLLTGLLVGWAVVPELARSTTAPGQATLPAPLRLETSPWLVLLAVGAVVVGTVVVVLAWRVRVKRWMPPIGRRSDE